MTAKNFLFLVIFIVLLIISINNLKADIFVNDVLFKADTAIFLDKKYKGLSKINSINDNQAMLFVYLYSGEHGFWMKDVNFPLDFLWIEKNKIIEISENINPFNNEGQITQLKPNHKVDKVLEIKAGTVSRCGIKIGDEVFIKYKY